jgi:hypothetical protein
MKLKSLLEDNIHVKYPNVPVGAWRDISKKMQGVYFGNIKYSNWWCPDMCTAVQENGWKSGSYVCVEVKNKAGLMKDLAYLWSEPCINRLKYEISRLIYKKMDKIQVARYKSLNRIVLYVPDEL